VGPSWGGRPIARRIADAKSRHRVVVAGSIVTAKTATWRNEPCHVYQLDDGTGLLSVVFTGPRAVPGMIEGARCTVEGTALDDGDGIVLWNPFYRFEP
jgi:hypothetical protein